MGIGEINVGDNPAMDKHPIQGGAEILLVTSCYRNRDKLWPEGRLYLYFFKTLYYNTSGRVHSQTFIKLTVSACAGVTVLCRVSSLSDLYEPVSDIIVACKI